MAEETTPRTAGTTAGSRRGIAWTPVVLGTLMVVIGVLCLVAPKLAGGRPGVIMALGGLLAASGLTEAVVGLRGGHGPHRGLTVAGGLLAIGVGVFILAQPATGLAALSLLLAVFFVAYGLFATIVAMGSRYRGWSWDFAFGLAALLLGGITVALWPAVALWLLATLVGVAIIARGASLMASGFGMHEVLRPAET